MFAKVRKDFTPLVVQLSTFTNQHLSGVQNKLYSPKVNDLVYLLMSDLHSNY